MKTITLFSIIGSSLLWITACTVANRTTENEVKELRHYVDSVEQNQQAYDQDESYWTSIDQYYMTRQEKIDAQKEALSEETKADYEKLKGDYKALKEKYTAERAKQMARITFRNALFGDVGVNNDLRFGFITAQNVASFYETFVTAVDNHKESYSREDWDEITLLYKAMGNRYDELGDSVNKRDNQKIAGQKIKFVAIKALNRPVSESESSNEYNHEK
jgi:hypothetical protein